MNWYNIVNSFKVSNDMSDKQIEEIFRQIKKYSRIVVMALPWLDMRKYMLVAHKLGMSDGDYAFLCIHGDLYTYDRMETDVFSDLVWRKNDSYDSIAKDAFEAVFHVMMKPLEKTHWNLFKKLHQISLPAQIQTGIYQNRQKNTSPGCLCAVPL